MTGAAQSWNPWTSWQPRKGGKGKVKHQRRAMYPLEENEDPEEETQGEDEGGMCPLLECEEDEGTNAPVQDADVDMEGWHSEPLLMDTGASSAFLRRGLLEHLPLEPPSEQDSRKTWSDTQGGVIRHKGTTRARFLTYNFRGNDI